MISKVGRTVGHGIGREGLVWGIITLKYYQVSRQTTCWKLIGEDNVPWKEHMQDYIYHIG